MYAERLQKLYERLPFQPFRDDARKRVVEWIVERQEADGSWGGIQPPWGYSLIALNIMGYGLDQPVIRKGIEGMQRTRDRQIVFRVAAHRDRCPQDAAAGGIAVGRESQDASGPDLRAVAALGAWSGCKCRSVIG